MWSLVLQEDTLEKFWAYSKRWQEIWVKHCPTPDVWQREEVGIQACRGGSWRSLAKVQVGLAGLSTGGRVHIP